MDFPSVMISSLSYERQNLPETNTLGVFSKNQTKHKKGYMETKPTYKKGKKVDDNPLMSASDFYLFRIYELVIISMIAQRLIVITVEFN